MKCNNYFNWNLLATLNQECIQNHWVWFCNQVHQLCNTEERDLVKILVYVYTTNETDLKAIKTLIKTLIYTQTHLLCANMLVSLTPIKHQEYIQEEITNLESALLTYTFHIVNIHLGLINLCFMRNLINEIILVSVATVHLYFIFKSLLQSI